MTALGRDGTKVAAALEIKDAGVRFFLT